MSQDVFKLLHTSIYYIFGRETEASIWTNKAQPLCVFGFAGKLSWSLYEMQECLRDHTCSSA